MFTIAQIAASHAKVKSGADFPAYIGELKEMGVTAYTTWVGDGHTDYTGSDEYRVSSPAKYTPLAIADTTDLPGFTSLLKTHQQGGSDYLTFIHISAASGVEKWTVDMSGMTCTYYDKAGHVLLEENIPQ